MDVSQLRSLIGQEQMRLTDIEAIFNTLVEYPDRGTVRNATRADLTEALEHACRSLVGVTDQMPPSTIRAITEATGSPAGDGSYGWGSDRVSEHSEIFVARLRQ